MMFGLTTEMHPIYHTRKSRKSIDGLCLCKKGDWQNNIESVERYFANKWEQLRNMDLFHQLFESSYPIADEIARKDSIKINS